MVFVCTDPLHNVHDVWLSWRDVEVNTKGHAGQVGRNMCIFWRGIAAKLEGHAAIGRGGRGKDRGL